MPYKRGGVHPIAFSIERSFANGGILIEEAIMKRKAKIVIIVALVLVGAAISIEKYFDRNIVYECNNKVTGLPFFIKISTYGAFNLFTKGDIHIDANYHHTDGEIHHIAGMNKAGYLDDYVYVNGFSGSRIHLDLLTGVYTVSREIDGNNEVLGQGVCIKK